MVPANFVFLCPKLANNYFSNDHDYKSNCKEDKGSDDVGDKIASFIVYDPFVVTVPDVVGVDGCDWELHMNELEMIENAL